MKCPVCVENGERSTVTAPSGSCVTLMAGHSYWDEHGLYHNHDPNTRTTQYRCSRGHRFVVSTRARCGYCDYGDAPATVRIL